MMDRDRQEDDRDRDSGVSSKGSSSSPGIPASTASSVQQQQQQQQRAGTKKPEAGYSQGPSIYVSPYGLPPAAGLPHSFSHYGPAAAEMLWKSPFALGGSYMPQHAAAAAAAAAAQAQAVHGEMMLAQERARQDRQARERQDQENKEREREREKERERERERLEKKRQEQLLTHHFEESLRLAQQKQNAAAPSSWNQLPGSGTAPPASQRITPQPQQPATQYRHPRGSPAVVSVEPEREKERDRDRYMAAFNLAVADKERLQQQQQQQQQKVPSSAAPASTTSPYSALPRADLNFSVVGYHASAAGRSLSGTTTAGGGVIVTPGDNRDRPSAASQVSFKPYEPSGGGRPSTNPGRSSRSPQAAQSTPPSGYPLHYPGPGPGPTGPGPGPNRPAQSSYMPPPAVSPSKSSGGPPYGYSPMYSSSHAPSSPSSLAKGKPGSSSPSPAGGPTPSTAAAASSSWPYGRSIAIPEGGITTGTPVRRSSPEQQVMPLPLTTSNKSSAGPPGEAAAPPPAHASARNERDQRDRRFLTRTAYSPSTQPLPPPQAMLHASVGVGRTQQQPLDLGPSYRDDMSSPISLVSSTRNSSSSSAALEQPQAAKKPKTEIPVGFPGLGSQPMMSVAALVDAAHAAAQGKVADPTAYALSLTTIAPVVVTGPPATAAVAAAAVGASPVKTEPVQSDAVVKNEPPETAEQRKTPPTAAETTSDTKQQQQPTVSSRPVHKLKTAWLQRHAGVEYSAPEVKTEKVCAAAHGEKSLSPAVGRKTSAIASVDTSLLLNGNTKSPADTSESDAAGSSSTTGRGKKKKSITATPVKDSAAKRGGAKPRSSAAAAVAATAAAAAAASSSGSSGEEASESEEEPGTVTKGRKPGRPAGSGRPQGRPRNSDSTSSKEGLPGKRGRGAGSSPLTRAGTTSNPFNKPPVAQLKKTGESFLQDGACWEVAPRLGKCRECRLTPHQRKKNEQHQNASIFCRFYAFRKLRYTKTGQLAVAGFSDPYKDALEDDLKLWLPQPDKAPKDLDVEMSAFLLTHIGDQFCLLVQQEKESKAEALALEAEDGDKLHEQIAWKRVVQGVREMCDVCETTLFNFHWACGKCGYVVCIDCYKSRCAAEEQQSNSNGLSSKDEDKEEKDRERDAYGWLSCSTRSFHDPSKLMPTQIIAASVLETMGQLVHTVRWQWEITQFCDCPQARDLAKKPIGGAAAAQAQQVSETNGVHKMKSGSLNGDGESSTKPKTVNGTDPAKKDQSGKKSGDSQGENSPLNWLADVALSRDKTSDDEKNGNAGTTATKTEKNNANGGEATSDDNSEDEEGSDNFSTLRELLIRPASKSGAKESSPAPAPKKPRLDCLETLEDVISCVIEQGVHKDAAAENSGAKTAESGDTEQTAEKKNDTKDAKELKHFKRRIDTFRTVRSRDPLPVRIMVGSESSLLYPDVPHSWLCNGRLLRLHDPVNPKNYTVFQDQWKRGQPVLVSGAHTLLDKNLWHPDSFCRDFGDVKNDLVNCVTGNLVPNQPMRKFWEGFERISKRLKDEKGQPMILKLKDWPPGDDFAEVLPSRFEDLLKCLPLAEYTHRSGRLNLAGRLPDCFVRPDLGPKMYNAYGSAQFSSKGTTNLHLDVSDAANVMVYVGLPKEINSEECMKEALKAIDDGGCDHLTRERVREAGEVPGALWHIYQPRDADRIRDLLNMVALERGERLEPHHDPIHDQSWYLDGPLRARLYQEYGVSGYTIVQCLGDVVFVPAGAPHQVRNLHSCIKVAEDFVSPENVAHCFQLTQEFRDLTDKHTNHEDKLQIKNIIYHAIKDSISVLAAARPLPGELLIPLASCDERSSSGKDGPKQ